MSGDGKGDGAAGKPGGTKKLLIVGLLAGLLVGGGAAAGYFLFLKPASPADTATSEAAAGEASAGEAGTPVPGSIFVKLDRLSVPMLAGDRVAGYMLFDLSLEVGKVSDELVVVKRLPAIRAAFLRDVSEAAIGKPDQPFLVDYDGLSARLKAAANRELGGAIVSRVLVVQAVRI